MLHDLLFELGTEELPSGSVKPLAQALAQNIVSELAKAHVNHGEVRYFATPRRLAVLIHGVESVSPSQSVCRRGPAVVGKQDASNTPSQALLGFATACGVSVDALTTITTEKGTWWAYESIQPGSRTHDLLPSLINRAVLALPLTKPMRWGSGDAAFVRPVHWAVLLLGSDVIPVNILGVTTGRHSFGHRFHHPHAVEISTPSAYESALSTAFVVADFEVRRQKIIDQAHAIASHCKLEAVMPDTLVDEVTSIVEWPNALLAQFDAAFLEVPSEALIAAMQGHQKCFALRDQEKQLSPHFITISNIASKNPPQVILGNEHVMRARLSDADFFYRQDKKLSLSHHLVGTERVIFQDKLGSLADKANRVKTLMLHIGPPLQLDAELTSRAAQLSKCDLLTGMVGEFPELQGVMGYYYALNDGESAAVALALKEQYMPRFAQDELPKSRLGLALSLADRLDTLVGTFSIGQKPTGVKDPFKLRRHALAVIRLLIATPVALNLSALLDYARKAYGDAFQEVNPILLELRAFILDRLLSFYQGQGVTPDLILAVRARQDDWLFDLDQRIQALLAFTKTPEASALAAACKRVNNLLQHAPSLIESQALDLNLLRESAEQALFESIQAVEQRIEPAYVAGDYTAILSQLAGLREPVDAFFEHVLVMDENEAIKTNRLCLLVRLQRLLQGVADISLLQSS